MNKADNLTFRYPGSQSMAAKNLKLEYGKSREIISIHSQEASLDEVFILMSVKPLLFREWI